MHARSRPAATLIAALLAAAPVAASAQPALVGATPAAGAVVERTATLQLNFSEAVTAKRSKVDLVMTSMPGMTNMPLMRMPVTVAVGGDGKALVLTAKAPLPAGTYKLNWAVAAPDKSTAQGSYDFTVR